MGVEIDPWDLDEMKLIQEACQTSLAPPASRASPPTPPAPVADTAAVPPATSARSAAPAASAVSAQPHHRGHHSSTAGQAAANAAARASRAGTNDGDAVAGVAVEAAAVEAEEAEEAEEEEEEEVGGYEQLDEPGDDVQHGRSSVGGRAVEAAGNSRSLPAAELSPAAAAATAATTRSKRSKRGAGMSKSAVGGPSRPDSSRKLEAERAALLVQQRKMQMIRAMFEKVRSHVQMPATAISGLCLHTHTQDSHTRHTHKTHTHTHKTHTVGR